MMEAAINSAQSLHEPLEGPDSARIPAEQLQRFRAYVAQLIEADIARREMQSGVQAEGPKLATDMRRSLARAESLANGLCHSKIEPHHVLLAIAIDPDGVKEMKARGLDANAAFLAAWQFMLKAPRSVTPALPKDLELSTDLNAIIGQAHELARNRVMDHRSTKTGDIIDVVLKGDDFEASRNMLQAILEPDPADRAAKGVEQLTMALEEIDVRISDNIVQSAVAALKPQFEQISYLIDQHSSLTSLEVRLQSIENRIKLSGADEKQVAEYVSEQLREVLESQFALSREVEVAAVSPPPQAQERPTHLIVAMIGVAAVLMIGIALGAWIKPF